MSSRVSSRHCVLVAVAALGCAAAGEDPGDPTSVKKDSGVHDGTFSDGTFGDSTGDGSDAGDSNHEGGPLFDAGPLCGDLGAPNTCDAVTDVGSIAIGDKKTVDGNVSVGDGSVWYRITFTGLDDPKAHPHIVLSGPDAGFGFLFEVVKTCHLEDLACSTGEGIATKLVEWEDKWAPDPTADGGPPSGDALIPLSVGTSGAVLVRVFRSGGSPTSCDGFKLDISN